MKKSMLSFLSALCLASLAGMPSLFAASGPETTAAVSAPATPTIPASAATVCPAVSEMPREAGVAKLPVISDILIFQYQQPAGEYTFQVVVDDPEVSCTWYSDGVVSDIPYPGDASFIDHPNLFKAVTFTTTGAHQVSVDVSNAAGHDYFTKTFYINSVK